MEKRVTTATDDMEKKFRVLAGDAFKRPLLQAITQDGSRLDGTTNLLSNFTPHLYSLFLTNAGEKRTEPISIRISIQSDCQHWSADWEQGPSGDTNYQASFSSKRTTTSIAPGQKFNIPLLELTNCKLNPAVPCELEVFYGGEQPLRSRFFIKVSE